MSNHREPWTASDDVELRRLYDDKDVLLGDIPDLLGRTYEGVRQHARRLGLKRWFGRPNKNTHYRCRKHGWLRPKQLCLNGAERIVCPHCGKQVKGKAPIPEEGLESYDYTR